MTPLPDVALFGYLEGYYGRLLDWPSRHRLLDALGAAGMNAWWYAPKEDATHRLRWRDPFEDGFLESFARFCEAARERRVRVIAGLAPGLDFDWRQVDGGADLEVLTAKSAALLEAGAAVGALLLDDIDDDFDARSADLSEGCVHAALANALGERLSRALVVVPRIYANELHATAPGYLGDFSRTLAPVHAVSVCGGDVVAREVTLAECRRHFADAARRTLVWDNLYANDYCPRRLFLGAWHGRDGIDELLLNPTGMPATDALLLDMVADARAHPARTPAERDAAAAACRARHGVPPSFERVERWFRQPVCNADSSPDLASDLAPDAASDTASDTASGAPEAAALSSATEGRAVFEALDELQWRWKSELSREWYPFLMGLRHDLQLDAGTLPALRIRKTQPGPLASALSRGLSSDPPTAATAAPSPAAPRAG